MRTENARLANSNGLRERKGFEMKILLAVDDSEGSADAVAAVASRPWPRDTMVRVLGAVETITPPPTGYWYGVATTLDPDIETATRYQEDLGARAADVLRRAGLSVDIAIRHGDPRRVIVDEANEWSADLIVVGSHSKTGLSRWLSANVASSVVDNAPCSVEVVRKKTEAA